MPKKDIGKLRQVSKEQKSVVNIKLISVLEIRNYVVCSGNYSLHTSTDLSTLTYIPAQSLTLPHISAHFLTLVLRPSRLSSMWVSFESQNFRASLASFEHDWTWSPSPKVETEWSFERVWQPKFLSEPSEFRAKFCSVSTLVLVFQNCYQNTCSKGCFR